MVTNVQGILERNNLSPDSPFELQIPITAVSALNQSVTPNNKYPMAIPVCCKPVLTRLPRLDGSLGPPT